MNMAKAMSPSDVVGEIIPMVDTVMELKKVTNLSSGAGGGDRDIVPLVRVDPEYPPRALQQRIGGYVDLQFTITATGTIRDAKVLASQPSFVFDRAALRAVRKWRYNPKVEEGVPVARQGVKVRLRFEPPRGR
jgi:protein TonB